MAVNASAKGNVSANISSKDNLAQKNDTSKAKNATKKGEPEVSKEEENLAKELMKEADEDEKSLK